MKRIDVRASLLWTWVAVLGAVVVAMVIPLVYEPGPPDRFASTTPLGTAATDDVVLDDPVLEFVTTVPAGFAVAPHVDGSDTSLVLVAEAWLPRTARISVRSLTLPTDTTGKTEPEIRNAIGAMGFAAASGGGDLRTADGRPALAITNRGSDPDSRIARFAVVRGATAYLIMSEPPDPATATQLAATRDALTTVVTTLRFRSG